jgi:hypothetical protein
MLRLALIGCCRVVVDRYARLSSRVVRRGRHDRGGRYSTHRPEHCGDRRGGHPFGPDGAAGGSRRILPPFQTGETKNDRCAV